MMRRRNDSLRACSQGHAGDATRAPRRVFARRLDNHGHNDKNKKIPFVSSGYILPGPSALIESAVVSSLSHTVTVSWYR